MIKDILEYNRRFDDVNLAVKESVTLLNKHPLMPEGISVYGYVMDTFTGELREVNS
ncbi:carbonic anhydrase [Clostridiales Family XIII bacterium PM5-7]